MTNDFILTTCPYCGCGCSFYLVVVNGKVVDVAPCFTDRISEGKLCIKGRKAHEFIDSEHRLTKPLVRRNGQLTETSWDEALDFIAKGISGIKSDAGPDAIGLLSSAKCTNEENYLMMKLARAVIGTNNVDHCARLCHASTVVGLAAAFGSGAMTNSIPEVAQAECILITGSNTIEQHPLIGTRVLAAKEHGATLIVIDPRETPLSDKADFFLRQKPGTDVAWLNGFMNIIIEENLHDDAYIRERTEGFEDLKKTVAEYTPQKVEQITGIPAEQLTQAARAYARADAAMILYAMGITQHSTGTNNVKSIANLAMLTGNVGKAQSGVNPLRGQNNVQGACDMGALPNVYSGYQKVSDPQTRQKFEKAWGTSLPEKPGLTVVEMMNAAVPGTPYGEQGRLRALYIMGENPMLSDPDINHVRRALEKLELLVVQDIFLTETAELADVVLPGASFAEKEGTFTNTDRTVLRVRKAIEPVGNSLADWRIICNLAQHLDGNGFVYDSPEQIMNEIANVTPSYGGISFERLDQGQILAWPCPTSDSPGTTFLHEGKFARGLGRFHSIEYIPTAEETDEQFPLILTTGRTMFHYHTGTMTRRIALLNYEVPTGYMEINPADAGRLQIANDEKVDVNSRRGHIEIPAKVTERVPKGTVFIPFHFAECAANMLTNPVLDPDAKIPVLKVCAVNVTKKN
ncbi:MAG: formate dehydrogenase subunit alpha [Sedimentisphaerales bacterium]